MLTDALIRKTQTRAKQTRLSDERGLYLLCAPVGGRWWRFKYRYAGKEKLLSLGTYSPSHAHAGGDGMSAVQPGDVALKAPRRAPLY
jgi:hypothetical protein